MGLEEPDHPTVGKKAPLSLKKPYLTKQQSPLSINATKEARDWYAKNQHEYHIIWGGVRHTVLDQDK